MTTRTTSKVGFGLIRDHEGFNAAPMTVDGERWVVGFGHVGAGARARVTRDEAEALLEADVAEVEGLVNGKVRQALTQAQFDALVSYAFSTGAEGFARSQVLRRINAGDLVAAANAMDGRKVAAAKPHVMASLQRRRAAEKALFLKDLAIPPIPSAIMRAELEASEDAKPLTIEAATEAAIAKMKAAEEAPASPLPARKRAPRKAAAAKPPVEAPVVQDEPHDIGATLTAILKSEAATAALFEAPVVIEDDVEDEIVTAHAKPVARDLETPAARTWRDALRQSLARWRSPRSKEAAA